MEARQEMEKLLDAKVFLEVWVKVKSGWADHAARVKSFGYEIRRRERCRYVAGRGAPRCDMRRSVATRNLCDTTSRASQRLL